MKFIGIRLRAFHNDPSQPNPFELYNIEDENMSNISIESMIDDIESRELIINLDAILEPVEQPEPDDMDEYYKFQQLEPFLVNLARNL